MEEIEYGTQEGEKPIDSSGTKPVKRDLGKVEL